MGCCVESGAQCDQAEASVASRQAVDRVLSGRDVPRVDKPCSLSGRKTLPRTQDEGGEETLL